MAASYQLPDILSLTSKFDLRANKYCRSVTLDSEAWLGVGVRVGERQGDKDSFSNFNGNGEGEGKDGATMCFPVLDVREREKIPGMKVGLLAALCFPTCDSPQLRLVVDFWSLLMCENERILRGVGSVKLGWEEENEGGAGAGAGDERHREGKNLNFIEILEGHKAYRCLVPRFRSMIQKTTLALWQRRFSASLLALREAQFNALKYRENQIVLPVDEYMDLRRDLSGLQLIFDLVEAVEGLNVDEVQNSEHLREMKRLAADVITASWDVFLYNVDQSLDRKLNLVAIIMSEYGIGISGAILQAGTWIKQKLDAFSDREKDFLSYISLSDTSKTDCAAAPPAARTARRSSRFWSYIGLSALASTPPSGSGSGIGTDMKRTLSTTTRHDAALFVQGLRDCIAGSVNWAFESEVFFGTKGDSVRGFGWVFLLPKQNSDVGE